MMNWFAALCLLAMATHCDAQEISCSAKVDIVFVFDMSGSIPIQTDQNARTFAKALLDHFTFGADTAKVGVVKYADSATQVISLTHDKQAVETAIVNMVKEGGMTNTYLGLQAAHTLLSDNPRTDAHPQIVLFTDGRSSTEGTNMGGAALQTAVSDIKNDGIEVFVFTAGLMLGVATDAERDAVRMEFDMIASAPSNLHVFITSNYDLGQAWGGLENTIVRELCADFPNCECSRYGETHYTTFDGAAIEFNGTCEYLLASYTGADSSVEDFRITLKNKECDTCVTKVTVTLHNVTFVMTSELEVKVNGEMKTVPLILGDVELRATTTMKIELMTGFGLTVEVGQSGWKIKTDKKFREWLLGLCGTCNSNLMDDYTTSGGVNMADVINNPGSSSEEVHTAYSKVASSFAVGDSAETCEGLVAPPTCPPWLETKVYSPAFCGLLLDKSGPFRRCIAYSRDLALRMTGNCIQDVCSCDADSYPKKKACNIIEAFAHECERLLVGSVDFDWRQRTGCALQCGHRQHYRPRMNACPATCANPSSEEWCNRGTTEGCACDPGYILEGNVCVPQSECGCHDFQNYYRPLGSVWFSTECDWKFACKNKENGQKQICLTRFNCPDADINCRVGDDPAGTYGCWSPGPCVLFQ